MLHRICVYDTDCLRYKLLEIIQTDTCLDIKERISVSAGVFLEKGMRESAKNYFSWVSEDCQTLKDFYSTLEERFGCKEVEVKDQEENIKVMKIRKLLNKINH